VNYLRRAVNTRWPTLLLAALVILLAASACSRIASPRGWASPVDGENVLLVSHRDKLYAVDHETLVDRQLFPPQPNDDDIDAEALYGTPAVSSDRVFVPTHKDELYAVNLEDGRIDWKFKADGRLIGGVLHDDGVLYFGSDSGTVYALDEEFGRPAWTDADGAESWFEADHGVWSRPAISGGVLYVTSLDGNLYALNATDGALLWQFDTVAGIASDPVVDELEGLVYFGGFDSKLHAVDLQTHAERWVLDAGNWFWTTPLVQGGVLYAGALDSKVYAVDAASGDAVWATPFRTDDPVRAAPVIAGGVLIIADDGGGVHGIDLQTGEDAFSGPLVLEDAVYADPLVRVGGDGVEVVFVMTTGGDLVEVDPLTLREAGTTAIGD
jgi:outer membrane protein assembly factor BamB